MFESIGVMIVFFFLLIFGMNFYFSVQESSLRRDFAKFDQMRAVQVAVQAQFLPELDCSYAGDITQKCVDLWKAEAFATIPKDRFSKKFGFANLTLSVLDSNPLNGFTKNITMYQNPKLEKGTNAELGFQYFELPLVVCDKNCDPKNPGRHYSFAVLKVKTYD